MVQKIDSFQLMDSTFGETNPSEDEAVDIDIV
jgi:hypothetical protein